MTQPGLFQQPVNSLAGQAPSLRKVWDDTEVVPP